MRSLIHRMLISWILVLKIHLVASYMRERICQGQVKYISCAEGTIVIHEAYFGRQNRRDCINRRYGNSRYTGCKRGVKKEIIKKCNDQKGCVVAATKDDLQRAYDACHGISKYLYIKWSCTNADLRNEHFCEKKKKSLNCGKNQIIEIQNVFWGLDKHEDKCNNFNRWARECESRYALGKTKQICDGKPGCTLVATRNNFGNPGCNRHISLSFEVTYKCIAVPPPTTYPTVQSTIPASPSTTTTISNVKSTTIASVSSTVYPTSLNKKTTKIFCERMHSIISCKTRFIDILDATFGRTDKTTCSNRGKTNIKQTCITSVSSDVKSRCQGKNHCLIQSSTRIFGNPCREFVNYLNMTYRCVDTVPTPDVTTIATTEEVHVTTEPTIRPTTTNGPKIRRLCENRNMILSCSNKMVINIKYAFFGRKDNQTCSSDRLNPIKNVNCSTDALKYMKYYCQDQTFCYVSSYAGTYGDPCPGTQKYLEFQYECITKGDIIPPTKMVIPAVPLARSNVTQNPDFEKCGYNYVQSGRVIGGKTPTKGQFPWQVAIYNEDEYVCGGSLIESRWIVTAAHCFRSKDASKYHVILGDHDRTITEGSETRNDVQEIFIHDKYDRYDPWVKSIQHDYDIALVKLRQPALFNKYIAHICLPDDTPGDEECFISGWGKTAFPGEMSGILQHTKMDMVNKTICQQKLSNAPGKPGDDITSNMFCAKGDNNLSNGCHGDSGGPYACFSGGIWKLRGVVSWGSPRCSIKDMYLVLTKVSQFKSWINDTITKDRGPLPLTYPTQQSTVPIKNSTTQTPTNVKPSSKALVNATMQTTTLDNNKNNLPYNETFCEGQERKLNCSENQIIKIQKVFWGLDMKKDKCNLNHFFANQCESNDALQKTKKICDGKRNCNIQATIHKFGNPNCSRYYYLSFNVTYKCVSESRPTTNPTQRSTVPTTHSATTKALPTSTIQPTTMNNEKTMTTPTTTTITTKPTFRPTTTNGPIIRRLCENRNMILHCSNERVINIKYAFFGRKDNQTCNSDRVNPIRNVSCSTDTLKYMKYYCQDQTFCYVNSNAGTYGDPCPGTQKYLEFQYECITKDVIPPTKTVIPQVPLASSNVIQNPVYEKCGYNYVQSGRVIGGNTPMKGQFPWQVAIYKEGEYICGGSLIESKWIITAAHCFRSKDAYKYHVILGDHDRTKIENSETRHEVQEIFVHTLYGRHDRWFKSIQHDYDIALVKLRQPAKFNKYIATICLPDNINTTSDQECFISGWGKTDFPGEMSGILQHTKMKFVDKEICQQKLSNAPGKPGENITSNMFCAKGADNESNGCHGDSGGPYACFSDGIWKLRGVVSWGSPRCSIKDMYLVLSKVSEFKRWIDYILNWYGDN